MRRLYAWPGLLLPVHHPAGGGEQDTNAACVGVQVACVSGAQLSSYATFLVHPRQAPLAIVLTALSTAAGVVVTPALALLLLGARLPIDAAGIARSIVQIVIAPVAAGTHHTAPELILSCWEVGIAKVLFVWRMTENRCSTCCVYAKVHAETQVGAAQASRATGSRRASCGAHSRS